MELHERLAEAFRVSGKSRSRLADEIGVTPAAISHWLLGRVRALKGESAARIEAATGVRASWLVTGQGPKLLDEGLSPFQEVSPSNSLPVLSAAQLKRWPEEAVALRQQAPVVLSESNFPVDSFAFQIDDLAMSPVFLPGDRVLCNPAVFPEPGDFVVARVQGARQTAKIVLRRYRLHTPASAQSEAHFSLIPINHDHPPLDSQHHTLSIMATMIEHRRYRAIG